MDTKNPVRTYLLYTSLSNYLQTDGKPIIPTPKALIPKPQTCVSCIDLVGARFLVEAYGGAVLYAGGGIVSRGLISKP